MTRFSPISSGRPGALQRCLMGLAAVLLAAGPVFPQQEGGGKEEYIIEHTLRLPKGPVFDVLISPDDRYLVTLASTHALRVWEAEDRRLVRDIRTGDHKAVVAVYHPKGGVIFTGGQDNQVMAWDTTRSEATQVFKGLGAAVTAVAVDAQGSVVAAGGANGMVLVWDAASGKELGRFQAHDQDVTSLAFHPDGQRLASGGKDRSVKVWDWAKGKPLVVLSRHTGAITQVGFHFKPSILASSSADGTIKLWNWEDPKQTDAATLVGHTKAVSAFAFHPNEEWLISSSHDQTIRIWSMTSRAILQELNLVDGKVTTMRLATSGKRILAAYPAEMARSWKLDKSTFLAGLSGHAQSVVSLDFSPASGGELVSVSMDKTVKVWDWQARKMARSFSTDNHQPQVVRYAPDGLHFATGGADGMIRVWNSQTGQVERTIQAHTGKVNDLAYHPNRPLMISVGSDKAWVIWDLASGAPFRRDVGGNDQLTAVAFSSDGEEFATGADDGEVRIWQVDSGKALRGWKAHPQGIRDLRFSPLGGLLASASKDGLVRLWKTSSGQETGVLEGHDFIVSAVRFSPDGRSLISLSRDKTVKLWDVQGAKFIRTISGEREQLLALAVSPDGKVLATGSIGTEIRLMVYPLKVFSTRRKETAAKPKEGEPDKGGEDTTAPEEESTGGDIDLAALKKDDTEKRPTYKFKKKFDAQKLRLAERNLNNLLAQGGYCRSQKEMDGAALDVLSQAPYDQAAYHALVNTAIVRQDMKMIALMAKVGKRALYLGGVYTYLPGPEVRERLELWDRDVFNGAYARAGRGLDLEFKTCAGDTKRASMPANLAYLDIPQETLRLLAAKQLRVDFSRFQDQDDMTFINQWFYLVEQAPVIQRSLSSTEEPHLIDVSKAPLVNTGLLKLDLASVSGFGAGNRLAFQLRRGRGDWLTYLTEEDRRKWLLLPEGHYYLKVEDKVARAFTIVPNGVAEVSLDDEKTKGGL
ncbi:MAG: WD40 repeat domain-containing protein [Deltaproteobacteria bacterium]|nr:WD40 repeat domain-containing protein [Deltaproteobacteria bacterium]